MSYSSVMSYQSKYDCEYVVTEMLSLLNVWLNKSDKIAGGELGRLYRCYYTINYLQSITLLTTYNWFRSASTLWEF